MMVSIRVDSVSEGERTDEKIVRITDMHGVIHEFAIEAEKLNGDLLYCGALISNERRLNRGLVEPPGRPKRGFYRIWMRWSDLVLEC